MGDVSYRPLMEDWTWSYSRIDAYNNCPYSFFCHYILKESEEPMFYSTFGSFVHEIFRKYFSGDIDDDDVLPEFLTKFSDNVEGKRPQESTVEKYINSTIKYLENFHGFGLKTLDVEKHVTFDISGIKMQGFIDLLAEDDDGNLYVIDHKSRELKQRSSRKKPTAKDLELDEMLKQLYIYSGAIKSEIGRFPDYLCFNCYRNGEFIKEPFDENKFVAVCKKVEREVNLIMDEDRFCPSEEYYKCRYLCGFSDQCVYHQTNTRNR